MAALRFLWTMLARAGLGIGRALHTLALLVGVYPALSRDPAIEAWQVLRQSRRRRPRKGRPGGARRRALWDGGAAGRGSVDDPHVRLRITM
jgi:hypothetical protein